MSSLRAACRLTLFVVGCLLGLTAALVCGVWDALGQWGWALLAVITLLLIWKGYA